MKKFFVKGISLYRKHISPIKQGKCVHYPTCSEYTSSAIEKYGVLRGVFMGLGRIVKCHPWQKNNFDPLK